MAALAILIFMAACAAGLLLAGWLTQFVLAGFGLHIAYWVCVGAWLLVSLLFSSITVRNK